MSKPMPSKQAMEAAQNIANVEGWEQDANLEEIAAIIDAAFAPVVAERDALKAALAEYCDDDEASNGFGSGCKTKAGIREIRERYGLK